MKVLVTEGYASIFAQLLECDIRTSGKSYDDALYNLQVAMAHRLITSSTDNTFDGPRAPPADWTDWDSGKDTFYYRADFWFAGEKLELPVLHVRTV